MSSSHHRKRRHSSIACSYAAVSNRRSIQHRRSLSVDSAVRNNSQLLIKNDRIIDNAILPIIQHRQPPTKVTTIGNVHSFTSTTYPPGQRTIKLIDASSADKIYRKMKVSLIADETKSPTADDESMIIDETKKTVIFESRESIDKAALMSKSKAILDSIANRPPPPVFNPFPTRHRTTLIEREKKLGLW